MKDKLNFIIIGAQKSGTTSLFEYLRRHPDITMPAKKEAPYFTEEPTYSRGWNAFMQKTFSSADETTQWGTASPQYMAGGLVEDPNIPRPTGPSDESTVPSRIAAQLPDVRLVAVLRDPIDRARSHHRMAHMNGLDKRSFEEAINELLSPEMLESSRKEPREINSYVTWGEYGRILSGYLEVFQQSQLLVVFTEELQASPEQVLQRIQSFIGVQYDFVPDNIGARYRVGATTRKIPWLTGNSKFRPSRLRAALGQVPAARRVWHSLPKAMRRSVEQFLDQVIYRIDLWNRRTNIDSRNEDSDSVGRLRAHYEADGRHLAEILGESIPWLRNNM
jgi:hypothetical protein